MSQCGSEFLVGWTWLALDWGQLRAPTSTVMNVPIPQIVVSPRANDEVGEAATRLADHTEDAR